MDSRPKTILAAVFIGIAATGVAWMVLRAQTPPEDPPGTTRTFKLGDTLYVYNQPRASIVFRFARFEDNLMIVSQMSDGNPGLDYSITLATGWKFTLQARIFEIQSWDKDKGTVTLTVIK